MLQIREDYTMSRTKKAPVDFLSHIAAIKPAVHKRITNHPDFDADKHNSLKGAMSLDGAMNMDECTSTVDSIKAVADEHGQDVANKLLFGEPKADDAAAGAKDDDFAKFLAQLLMTKADPNEPNGDEDDEDGDDDDTFGSEEDADSKVTA